MWLPCQLPPIHLAHAPAARLMRPGPCAGNRGAERSRNKRDRSAGPMAPEPASGYRRRRTWEEQPPHRVGVSLSSLQRLSSRRSRSVRHPSRAAQSVTSVRIRSSRCPYLPRSDPRPWRSSFVVSSRAHGSGRMARCMCRASVACQAESTFTGTTRLRTDHLVQGGRIRSSTRASPTTADSSTRCRVAAPTTHSIRSGSASEAATSTSP